MGFIFPGLRVWGLGSRLGFRAQGRASRIQGFVASPIPLAGAEHDEEDSGIRLGRRPDGKNVTTSDTKAPINPKP